MEMGTGSQSPRDCREKVDSFHYLAKKWVVFLFSSEMGQRIKTEKLVVF